MKRGILSVLMLILLSYSANAQHTPTTITLDASSQEYRINKNIYGQFAEHLGHLVYGGIWVGPESDIPNIHGIRKDVVEALRRLRVPVLRWPGGCFADEYHWMDGIGPKGTRPKMINTNWGGVTEDNGFGTHEFLELCNLVGCEPYITGNLGSGTVRELSQWVEYVNSDNISPMADLRRKNGREMSWGVRYWGVGNESWGCGGRMVPEYYVNEAKKYANFMRAYGDNTLYCIACGPSEDDYAWTTTLMKGMGTSVDGLSLHYYASGNARTATDIDRAGWFDILKKSAKMDELITKHAAIMDTYDPFKRVALVVDEWGTWYKVEPGTNPGFLYQQNTLRDALAAGMTLNIFNNHADRVRMANIAQVVNVLQAMILTEGKKMVLTPTYHVFALFRAHQDAMMVPVRLTSRMVVVNSDSLPAVNCSASIDSLGEMHVSLCNVDPDAAAHVVIRPGHYSVTGVSGEVLTADRMNARNTFDHPDAVRPVSFGGASLTAAGLEADLPPMSVVMLSLHGDVRLEPAQPVKINNPAPGLHYSYFETSADGMPAFSALTPKSAGSVDSVVLPREIRDSNFGVVYDGFIKIPKQGVYTFSTTSDDGSVLVIDGKMVVSNDGRHAPLERSGVIQLQSGFHRFRILYFQAGGGYDLSASIGGPGIRNQVIPSGMLFREK